jgi:predicted esterase
MLTPTFRVALLVATLSVNSFAAQAAAEPAPVTAPASPDVFNYDRSAPLDIREIASATRDGAVIREITFVGVKSPVKAFIVSPVAVGESLAGILYTHWLGDPETTNATEFLNEAVALSGQGVVSVLVEAMWSQPKWYQSRVPEEDYAHSVQQVIELRRAMDVLLQQPRVDPKRIAYVGHDFGAMYGIVMGAVDRRASTYVLMAGTPHFIDWFLFAQKPKSPEQYRRQLAPIDPINFVGQLAPAPVFFQFASRDEYVTAEAAAAFYAAAQPRKQTALYNAGHDLRVPEASADRVTWLIRSLAAKP